MLECCIPTEKTFVPEFFAVGHRTAGISFLACQGWRLSEMISNQTARGDIVCLEDTSPCLFIDHCQPCGLAMVHLSTLTLSSWGSEGYRGYVMQQNSLLPWRPCLEYRKRRPVVFLKHSGAKAAEDPTLIGDFKMRAPPASILI